MILGSVLQPELPTQTEVWLCLGLSVASNLVMFAVAYAFTLLLRIPDGHRGVYRFMLCFGNVGFIGYPVLSAIFGPDALVYAAVFNLPFNFFVFTVGAWFLTQDTDGDVKVQTTWRTFVTPVMLSCVAAVLLTLGGIHYADSGGCAGFFAPAPSPRRRRCSSSARRWRTCRHATSSAARVFGVYSVFPSVNDAGHHLGRLHAFVPAGLMFSVAVVLAGMPVATNGTMLCYQYGGNSRVMAQGTFVTTVLAIASIPLLAGFVGVVM